jgi:hypothetical protein
MALGHEANAEPACQRALSILEKTSPPDYPNLIDALNTYALLLLKTKRKAEAELVQTRIMVYRARWENRSKKSTREPS